MKRGMKIAIGVGVLGVVGVIVAAGAMRGDAGVEVRVETVATRDLVANVTASGWIRPYRAVEVQADIMGRITELWVAEGDSVKKGQLLLRIDPTQYEAAVARAQAAVSEALAREAQARANLLQAERARDRALALAGRDSTLVSRQALEEAETRMMVERELREAAGHGVDQARAALREAQNQLAKTTIRAPIDGVVTRLNVEEGETAIVGTMNNPGSLLLTISDPSKMEAVVRVDETDIPDLALGDSASVKIDAYPRRSFVGRVTTIAHSSVRPPSATAGAAPGGQAQAVDFEVVITLDDPPPVLRTDLSATAEIVTETRRGALAIPIIALTVREQKQLEAVAQESPEAEAAATATLAKERTDEEGVFVIRGGKATFVPIQIGIAGTEHFEVVSGLAAGDSVVAGPYEAIRKLEDGKPVRLMKNQESQAKSTPEAKQ